MSASGGLMTLSAELLAAYQDADYVVFGDPDIVLRVGEPSPRLDALLEAEGAATAAYITAANPLGERRSKARNALGVAALEDLIAASRARGATPKGAGPPSRACSSSASTASTPQRSAGSSARTPSCSSRRAPRPSW